MPRNNKINQISKAETKFKIIEKNFFQCKNQDFNLMGKCPNFGWDVRT